jgi:predicted glycoside hydrolase/deacetylase ChbG (UPF0249 family)
MKSSPKRLIVNADDLGLSTAVNNAVEKCYRAGAITGASLMATGPGFQHAVGVLKGLGERTVGAHLALTGNMPPCTPETGEVASLLGPDGLFLRDYAELGVKYISGKIEHEEVILEFRSQIKRITKEGFTITHLDSHEHVHMLPGLFDKVAGLAEEFGIPYVRVPRESISVMRRSFALRDAARHVLLKGASVLSSGPAAGKGIFRNDSFLGHFHSGRITEDIFLFMLDGVKGGVTEAAFHPLTEMDVLLGGKWKARAGELGIQLVTHLQAAS